MIVGGRALVRQQDKLEGAFSAKEAPTWMEAVLNPDDQVGERKLRIVQDEISKIQEDTKKRENTRQPEVLPPQSSCRFCSGAADTQSPTRAERCDGDGFRFVFFIVSLCTFRILVLVF